MEVIPNTNFLLVVLCSKTILPNCRPKGERVGVPKEAPPRKRAAFDLWSTYLLKQLVNMIPLFGTTFSRETID